jgi:hypothetical protein
MYDTTPKTRRRYCPISITACVISALVMIPTGVLDDGRPYRVALTVFMLAATALITLRTGVNTEIVEKARQTGWDEGWDARGEIESATDARALRAV